MAEETPTRWPSNAELDLEARQKAADQEQGEVGEVYAPFAVEGNDTSGYVGVSPEYMTYANETDKPLRSEEGVEKDLEDKALGEDASPLLESAKQVGDAEPNPASPAGVAAQVTVDNSADSGNTPPVPPAPTTSSTKSSDTVTSTS